MNYLKKYIINVKGFDKIYSLSYMWISPVGVVTVIVVSLVVSVVTNYFIKQKPVDASLILYKYKSALKLKVESEIEMIKEEEALEKSKD